MAQPAPVRDVTVEVDGVKHKGTYYVQDSTVFVRSPIGSKATQVGGSQPSAIARMLLSELAREAKGKVQQ